MNLCNYLLGDLCRVSESVVVADGSSALLLLYVMSYALNKKGCFLVAFILVEFISYSHVFESLSEVSYYLLKATVYAFLYWVLRRYNFKLKVLVPCGIMVLFQFFMGMDSKYYGQADSFLYSNHSSIVIFIHILIISSLHNWKRLGRVLGDAVRVVRGFFSDSDAIAFIWYNCKTYTNQAIKKMSDPNLVLLITELITSQKETNESIKETNKAVNHLSGSVDKLITDNKVREEKDKYQDEKNVSFATHIEKTNPTVNRLKLALGTWDKVKIPLIVVFIIAVMTALNFNFGN